MYVITGATGNIGSTLAGLLIDAGKPVRAVGRNRERLQPLVEAGAALGRLNPSISSGLFA